MGIMSNTVCHKPQYSILYFNNSNKFAPEWLLSTVGTSRFKSLTFKKQVKVMENIFRDNAIRRQMSKSINVSHKFLRQLLLFLRYNFFLNCLPSKSRSRSRSAIFAITPFDGKCQNLQCLCLILCALALAICENYFKLLTLKMSVKGYRGEKRYLCRSIAHV